MSDTDTDDVISPGPHTMLHESAYAPWSFLKQENALLAHFTKFQWIFENFLKLFKNVLAISTQRWLTSICFFKWMLCFRSLRRCAPGPQTMLEASHMPEASIHGSLLARPGVSLRENERFPPQHCLGSGGSRLHFGAYAAAHHQESFRKHNENVFLGQ